MSETSAFNGFYLMLPEDLRQVNYISALIQYRYFSILISDLKAGPVHGKLPNTI